VSNCDTHLNVDKPHFPRPSLIKSFTSIRQMSAETASCGDPGTMARNMLQTAPDLGSRAHQGRLVMCSGREREKRFTWRERERLQCFSQPASLITYRRRQRSNVESIKTVQNELENLHMILLCKKGSHGVCVRGKQRSILLPNCLESWTLKNHVQFICNSHTTTMCADPIGSGNMLTPSKTPENDWQLMRAQPKL